MTGQTGKWGELDYPSFDFHNFSASTRLFFMAIETGKTFLATPLSILRHIRFSCIVGSGGDCLPLDIDA